MKALHVRVEGRVQGVWFRASTLKEAQRLGVDGWVRNTADGDVEIFMQGEDEAVARLLSWCYQGPPCARVLNVQLDTATPDNGVRDFTIRH